MAVTDVTTCDTRTWATSSRSMTSISWSRLAIRCCVGNRVSINGFVLATTPILVPLLSLTYGATSAAAVGACIRTSCTMYLFTTASCAMSVFSYRASISIAPASVSRASAASGDSSGMYDACCVPTSANGGTWAGDALKCSRKSWILSRSWS